MLSDRESSLFSHYDWVGVVLGGVVAGFVFCLLAMGNLWSLAFIGRFGREATTDWRHGIQGCDLCDLCCFF